MSIVLHSVELSNIQVHESFVFTPDENGITAIRGANGTGKSTIVDSIAWALYGIKPPGVAKMIALYREGAEFSKDKCFVKIDLTVDGRHFIVERKMLDKHGKTECNVIEYFIQDDGSRDEKHQAGPAVSHSEKYIRKLLKMDANGFLTAILIQQKQVDKLISATTSQRGAVIEKLTGVSAITQALKNAREDLNVLNKMSKSSTVDEKELESNIQKRDKMKKSVAKKREKLETDKEKLDKAEEESQSLTEQVNNEYEKIQQADKDQQKIRILEAQIEVSDKNLADAIAEKDEAKSSLSSLSAVADVKSLSDDINKARKSLRSKELVFDNAKSNIESSEKTVEQYNEIIQESKKERSVDEAREELEAQELQVEKLRIAIEKMHDDSVSYGSEVKKLDRAIKVLSADNGTCPTCLQDVADVTTAVDALNSQKDDLQSKISENNEKIVKYKESLAKKLGTVDKFEQLIEALSKRQSTSVYIEEQTKVLNSAKGEIKALEKEIEALNKVYDDAKKQADKKDAYDKLVRKVKELIIKNDGQKEDLSDAKERLKNSGVISESALEKLRKKSSNAADKYNKLSLSYSELLGDVRVEDEQLRTLSVVIETQEKEVKEYEELLSSKEHAQSVVKVIEEFREDRIRNSVPVIEAYASDLLSRFTENKFTAVRMDSKFNARVVLADGSERAVGSLSGGELSLTSIALLISISMLLNGSGAKNPIILDEVFVSQDANRAELSISTIKEVCQGQVIMIAHNESLDAVADKIVQLG